MNVYKFNELKINYNIKKSVIILGAFEFFHKGHETLLDKARKISKEKNIEISIMTFDDCSKLNKNSSLELIELKTRLKTFSKLGINNAIVLNFNQIKNIEGDKFINQLKNNYNVEHFISGEDFRFGKGAKWNANNLENLLNNNYTKMKNEKIKNTKISSRKIKEYFNTGEISLINSLLFDPIKIRCLFENKLIINEFFDDMQSGIYLIYIEFEGYNYQAILHISINKISKIKFINKEIEMKKGNYYYVSFIDVIRAIISIPFDEITENDIRKSVQKFPI